MLKRLLTQILSIIGILLMMLGLRPPVSPATERKPERWARKRGVHASAVKRKTAKLHVPHVNCRRNLGGKMSGEYPSGFA